MSKSHMDRLKGKKDFPIDSFYDLEKFFYKWVWGQVFYWPEKDFFACPGFCRRRKKK
jgi:hypothetical protein